MDKKLFDKKTLNLIQKKLNYKFKNKDLINKAFTHSSFAHGTDLKDNERFEFLGDSVLQLCTTNFLFSNLNFPEGVLSKIRAYVVSTENLSNAIDRLQLVEYLKMTNPPSRMVSIKADLFEAVVGVIYLDGGYKSACNFIKSKLNFSRSEFLKIMEDSKDYKTQLQEIVQSKNLGTFKYNTKSLSGPSHNPEFSSELFLDNKVLSKGNGYSKKEAESSAAKKAVKKLNKAIDAVDNE